MGVEYSLELNEKNCDVIMRQRIKNVRSHELRVLRFCDVVDEM